MSAIKTYLVVQTGDMRLYCLSCNTPMVRQQGMPMPVALPVGQMPFALDGSMEPLFDVQVQGYVLWKEQAPDEAILEKLTKLQDAHVRKEKEDLAAARRGIVLPTNFNGDVKSLIK